MSRARELSRLGNPNIISADSSFNVGFGTAEPKEKVNVVGVVSATSFFGDGSTLDGIASAGIGTALSDDKTKALNTIYFTNDEVVVTNNSTVNPPASGHIAYTQAPTVVIDDTKELIVSDGDDLLVDVLGISTGTNVDFAARGNGVFDNIYADNIESKGGQTAVNFPKGLVSSGVATFTSDVSIGGTLTYEDVKNIDSVGLITARTGIKVSAGGIEVSGGGVDIVGDIGLGAGKQTGTAGQLLTSGGAGADASWTSISAAPTAEGVAHGSIGVGTAVAVRSDGKFVAVTGTNSFHGLATEVTPDPTSRNRVIYAPDVDKLVTSYVGYSDDKTWVVVGTASADGKTVTWDNGNKSKPNTTGSEVSAYQDICYDTTNNKVICVFRDEGSRIDSAVGTISGTSITWGSLDTLDSAGSNTGCSVAFDSSTGKVIAVWRATSTTYELRAGTVSGTNITWGTVVTATTGDTANTPHIAAENGHFVITGRDNYHVGSYSGTTITMAAAEGTIPFSDGNTSTDDTPITVDPATSTYMMGGCRDYTDKYPEVFAATRSGTTLTFGDGQVLNSFLSHNLALCPAGQQNKFFASWGYSNLRGYSATLEVVGTKITMSEPYLYNASSQENHGSAGCVFNPDKGVVVVVYMNYGDSRDAWYYVEGMRNSTGTRGGFVGFSNAAYTNGQTAKVSIVGAVSTNQSGLTAAQPYYLKGDGTLDTSPASGDFLVGNALSSTNLLLR